MLFLFQNRIPVRGDPHILVVGDPGLGKSQVGEFEFATSFRFVLLHFV